MNLVGNQISFVSEKEASKADKNVFSQIQSFGFSIY